MKQHKNKGKICARKGCFKEARTRGLCMGHYNVLYQHERRKKQEAGLVQMRFGKRAKSSDHGIQERKVAPNESVYSFEDARWREGNAVIARLLQLREKGLILWAMPIWGDGARGLDADAEAQVLIDYYAEHHPRNFQPWKKQDYLPWKDRPVHYAFHQKVRDTCRTVAATIANHLRWELQIARENSPGFTPDEDLLRLREQALEEW